MPAPRSCAIALVLLLSSFADGVALFSDGLGGSRIGGVVLDVDRRPIEGVRIRLRDTPYETASGEDGRFLFADVAPGDYVLDTNGLGYAARSDTIAVLRGQELSLEIGLVGSAVDLPPLLVVVRSQRLVAAGFYERRSHGGGTFITREQIEARHVERLSDILARLPGLHRNIRGDGSASIGMRGVKTIATPCRTEYFVDGIPALLEEIGVDAVPVHDVEGIEVYRGSSELPIQYHAGRAMCGAILIWTRDGST